MKVLQRKRRTLLNAANNDVRWMREGLDNESSRFATRVQLEEPLPNSLIVRHKRWQECRQSAVFRCNPRGSSTGLMLLRFASAVRLQIKPHTIANLRDTLVWCALGWALFPLIPVHLEYIPASNSIAPLSDVLTRQAMLLHHTMVLLRIPASTRYT